VSVIKDNGTVVDSSDTSDFSGISLRSDYRLVAVENSGHESVYLTEILNLSDGFSFDIRYADPTGGAKDLTIPFGPKLVGSIAVGATSATQKDSGLIGLMPDFQTPSRSAYFQAVSTYNTGWLVGDTKLATLSDTDDTDVTGSELVTNGTFDTDLTGWISYGTITKTPVATGADLVGYSGFSTSNYLQQPYNSDLDFGTGDFSVMGWVKTTATVAGGIASTQDDNLVDVGFAVLQSASTNGIVLISSDGVARSVTTGTTAFNDGSWHHFVASRTNSGATQSIYIDGSLDLSETVTVRDITATSKPLTVGQWFPNASPKYHFAGGSIALLRISATAPTAEQIAKIYEDEKVLFQENSQATLYGTSDEVRAMGYDEDTELLHLGTTSGRSVFNGLRRVDNTTGSVAVAISASNNFIVEE
jgi:hypothetical protein